MVAEHSVSSVHCGALVVSAGEEHAAMAYPIGSKTRRKFRAIMCDLHSALSVTRQRQHVGRSVKLPPTSTQDRSANEKHDRGDAQSCHKRLREGERAGASARLRRRGDDACVGGRLAIGVVEDEARDGGEEGCAVERRGVLPQNLVWR